jgi:dihydrofolate synthase/folylpolyglutamate synthase
LYTSPHVHEYRERITNAGRFFPDELYRAAGRRIREVVETSLRNRVPDEELPSTFELLTLMAFLVFRDAGVDYAVIETGMGGRLDATNVVDPLASVLTPIELEHTEYLGDTISQIAGEKVEITKPGRPVFISAQKSEAADTFRRRIPEIGGSPVWLNTRLKRLTSVSSTAGNELHLELSANGRPLTVDTRLSLLGRVQAENAALAALVCAEILPTIGAKTIARGLAETRIPGRGEIIPGRGALPVVLDGAHTPNSVRALVELLREIGAAHCVVIFGSVDGKKHREMISTLVPVTAHMVVARPGNFKPSSPALLLEEARAAGLSAEVREEAADALEAAVRAAGGSEEARHLPGGVTNAALHAAGGTGKDGGAAAADGGAGNTTGGAAIVVTGSFYLVGAIRPLVVPT